MSTFTLRVGLLIRYGASIYSLKRVSNLGKDLSFEHTETGAFISIELDQFYKLLQERELVVIDTGSDDRGLETAVHPRLGLTPVERTAKEIRKSSYVQSILEANVPKSSEKMVKPLITACAKRMGDNNPPSVRQLARWVDRHLAGEAVISQNRKGRPAGDYPVELEFISRHYLQRDQLSVTDVYSLYVVEQRKKSTEAISYSTFWRLVKSLDKYAVLKARKGKSVADRDFRTTLKTDADVTRPNQRWQLDHTPLNYVVICERNLPLGRPTLTAVIDAYAGYVVAIFIYFGNSRRESIFTVLRAAICPEVDENPYMIVDHEIGFGMPEMVVVDNGAPEQSIEMKARARELGFDLEFCAVRKPYQKPHIEGFFSRLNNLPISSGRIRKTEEHSESPKETATISFTDLRRCIKDWVNEVNHTTINRLTLERPIDRMTEGLKKSPPARLPINALQYSLIAATEYVRTVDHKGIQIASLLYSGPEIVDMRNRFGTSFKTNVRIDTTNLNFIYVRIPQSDRWVKAYSQNTDYTNGLSLHQHLVIRRQRLNEINDSGLRLEWIEARGRVTNSIIALEKKGRKVKMREAKERAVMQGADGIGSNQVSPQRSYEKPSGKKGKSLLSVDIEILKNVKLDHIGGR